MSTTNNSPVSLLTESSGGTTVSTENQVALVPSYLSGAWVTPDNPTRVVQVDDASTGEPVARVSTDGLDIAGVLHGAGEIGRAHV